MKRIRRDFEVIGEDDYLGGHPSDPNYKSFHMVIRGKAGPQEIQIRTENEDRWGDWFHDVYKPRTDRQAKEKAKNLDRIMQYASDVSAYFFSKDSDKQAGSEPKCPEVVRQTFGCL